MSTTANSGPGAQARGVDVVAAGGIIWRKKGRQLQILLIHRPRYDDWSFPKGKLEKGEDLRSCAVREIAEEARIPVALHRPAGVIRYRLSNGSRKEVTYWVGVPMPVDHPSLRARPRYKDASKNEIDKRQWLPAGEALTTLTSSQDQEILRTVLAWDAEGTLDTRTLVILRHARAVKRSNWKKGKGAEDARPLTEQGERRAELISAQLALYAARRLASSPWRRCVRTLAPYSEASKIRIVERPELTESAHKEHKKPVARTVEEMISHLEDTAVLCIHRPTLPTVLGVVRDYAEPSIAAKLPRDDPYLKTGELLILHVARSSQAKQKVVAVERYRPVVGRYSGK